MRITAFLGKPPNDGEAALIPWTCLNPGSESEEVACVSYLTQMGEASSAVSHCQ